MIRKVVKSLCIPYFWHVLCVSKMQFWEFGPSEKSLGILLFRFVGNICMQLLCYVYVAIIVLWSIIHSQKSLDFKHTQKIPKVWYVVYIFCSLYLNVMWIISKLTVILSIIAYASKYSRVHLTTCKAWQHYWVQFSMQSLLDHSITTTALLHY